MAAPASLPPFKRGDQFALFADYSTDGEPDVFAATQLRSQLRNWLGRLVAELTVAAVSGVPGRFTVSYTDTAGWPTGNLVLDIKRTSSAGVRTTSTVVLPVVRRETT